MCKNYGKEQIHYISRWLENGPMGLKKEDIKPEM